MKLLKEIANTQNDLKKSNTSDAGTMDTASKTSDVSFNLMRNAINDKTDLDGADISNYLAKAEKLNDIDTVAFAVEISDKKIPIKIYVAAAEASAFEEALASMLGIDNDYEVAINTLAQKFDIVDVIWPESDEDTWDEESEEPGESDSGSDEESDEDVADLIKK